MSFTGAANRADASGGFGQGETRPQAFTGLNGKGYLIGRTQNRIIEIADISDPDTSTYVSAVIGSPNSMAAHNGSLYVFIGKDLIRFDTPFSDTDTGTDVFSIDEIPRALTSDGTNLYYIHQLSTLNFLYRIDDLDGTPTVVALGRVGDSVNIRGLVWHDGFFWGVDASSDRLVKIILTGGNDDPHTVENVGSFSQFVGPITNPQGFGVVNGVGYITALDNDGSLWELRDFKFTDTIADQSWTVGEAVSIDAPATEDGASPITFAITPELPAGMTFDTTDGSSDGTPTAISAKTEYTITATDTNGILATTTFAGSVAASGTLPPTPTDAVLEMTVSPISVTAGGIATVTFTFDKAVGNFTDADVTVSAGATKGTLTRVGNTNVWTMPVTAPSSGSGTVTVSVAADAVTPGNNADSVQFTYTAPPPPVIEDAVLEITVNPNSVTAGNAATVTFSFNKSVSGFTAADVTVSAGATKGTLTRVGNTNVWTMPVTAPSTGSGTVTVSVDADAVSPGNNADSVQFAYTAPPPVIEDAVLEITVNPSSVTAGNAATVTFSFNKSVTGFTAADVNVSAGATKGTLRSQGTNVWTMPVTAPSSGSGTVTVSVDADAVSPGNNADSVQFTYTAPQPPPPTDAVLDITVSPGSVTAGGVATVTFRFDKSVSGFTAADVNVSAGATKGTLRSQGTNVWTMPVTAPSSGSGTVTVSVGADVVSPGNNADSVQFAYTAPADAVLDISVNPNSVTAGGVATVTFAFSKPVSGFTASDVRVSTGATKGTLRSQGTNVWTMPVTAPSSGSGMVTVSVRADVVSPGNNADSVGFTYIAAMAPSAPQNVRIELTSTTALVRWGVPSTDGGAGIEEYEVSYAEGANPGTTWIPTGSTRTRFLVKRLKRGTQYTFGVRGRNSEGAGAASRPVTERTPIASLHNALFFKECINYFDDGGRVSEHGNPSNIIRAIADNNYKTSSTVKDYTLNIAIGGQPTRVDAFAVKGKGIARHSGTPMGGSGSGWTDVPLPATLKNWEGTEVSTTVAGFQHHLYLLPVHFTATSVRVQFEGTGVEIYEIMLLEFGLEIDANSDFTQINPDFVDREGVVHPDPGGGIVYDPPIGNQRDKWQVDYVVKIVPGKTMLETPEDFLYWRAENRNHVHAMEPSRFPWRVFPAVFVRKSVPVRYRTDDKLGGEILNFRVAEQ